MFVLWQFGLRTRVFVQKVLFLTQASSTGDFFMYLSCTHRSLSISFFKLQISPSGHHNRDSPIKAKGKWNLLYIRIKHVVFYLARPRRSGWPLLGMPGRINHVITHFARLFWHYFSECTVVGTILNMGGNVPESYKTAGKIIDLYFFFFWN